MNRVDRNNVKANGGTDKQQHMVKWGNSNNSETLRTLIKLVKRLYNINGPEQPTILEEFKREQIQFSNASILKKHECI